MAQSKKEVNPQAPSNNRAWSKKDVKTLKEMISKNFTSSEIARELGRTRASIWARKYMLGLNETRLPSSKGQKGLAPVSVGSRVGGKKTIAQRVKARREKIKDQVQTPMATSEAKAQEFAALIQMAQKQGAKIVITFE